MDAFLDVFTLPRIGASIVIGLLIGAVVMSAWPLALGLAKFKYPAAVVILAGTVSSAFWISQILDAALTDEKNIGRVVARFLLFIVYVSFVYVGMKVYHRLRP